MFKKNNYSIVLMSILAIMIIGVIIHETTVKNPTPVKEENQSIEKKDSGLESLQVTTKQTTSTQQSVSQKSTQTSPDQSSKDNIQITKSEEEPRVKSIAKLTKIQTFASWDNWNSDPEYDGIWVGIYYEDYYGADLSTEQNAKMPISADIKLYTLKSEWSDIGAPDLETNTEKYTNKLVYSGHFDQYDGIKPYDRTAYDTYYFYTIFRIPKESIKVDPSADLKRGIAEIIIHTPSQGDFKGIWNHVDLYLK